VILQLVKDSYNRKIPAEDWLLPVSRLTLATGSCIKAAYRAVSKRLTLPKGTKQVIANWIW